MAESRRGGIRLFDLMGIEIRLDFSVLFIFGLIVYSLASGVFPSWHPDWTAGGVWSTAFAAGLLFFASLLAHEMAHSLVARRFGIRVPRITLFLFGGMAEIESEAETPGAEFAIAIAGPAMSLLIALGCLLFVGSAMSAEAVETMRQDLEQGMAHVGPSVTVALWLGTVNFMLAVFNMVPGFPLDGGRVARAVIWRLTGDHLLATRHAANAGKWFGWIIMALGLWELLALKSFGGLWMILIGWFLSHLATQSYAQASAQKALQPLRVRDLMRTRFGQVDAATTVAAFVDEYLLASSQSLWPVIRDGECIGTLSLTEVMGIPAERRATTSVADIAVPLERSGAIDPDLSAVRASQLLAEVQDRPVPVVSDRRVVGLLRTSDVLRWLMVKEMPD